MSQGKPGATGKHLSSNSAARQRAKVIAFLNFKGGVGKTANVVNIAACLAATHQQRVLVVDLDAQCNASLWLMRKPEWRSHTEGSTRSVHQLFLDAVRGTKLFNFEDAALTGIPRSERGYGLIGSLHLLPAVVELLDVEDQIAGLRGAASYKVLHTQLKPRFADYDYVLLDCPPNFFAMTKNAVFCAQYLVIPYIPDFLSLSGFQTLARLVERFDDQISGSKTAIGRARISAIVVNRYKKVGNVFQQGLLELERLADLLKQKKLIHPKTAILSPPVRDCVKVAEAPALHLPVLLHAPGSNGAVDYSELTQAFIEHFERF